MQRSLIKYKHCIKCHQLYQQAKGEFHKIIIKKHKKRDEFKKNSI